MYCLGNCDKRVIVKIKNTIIALCFSQNEYKYKLEQFEII